MVEALDVTFVGASLAGALASAIGALDVTSLNVSAVGALDVATVGVL